MWLKWLPWRFIVKHVAKAHGFLDPIALQARLQRFTQPSEVAEPIELLRAGVVLHARGLINSRVIQHNLDWVWPYWIERQFNPRDPSFVPRAFSITHINLTHRNWTAIGLPDGDRLPIVDPRGLLTPLYDGWSLDAWILAQDGRCLLPSRAAQCSHELLMEEDGLRVSTAIEHEGLTLHNQALVSAEHGEQICQLRIAGRADTKAFLVLALRPYNPEGVSFIHKLELSADRRQWLIDADQTVTFSAPADRHHVSDYRQGDVYSCLSSAHEQLQTQCDVGMVTAAALFALEPGVTREISARIPLQAQTTAEPQPAGKCVSWSHSLSNHCRLQLPDTHLQFLYDAAIRTLILHAPNDVYPGPYTYKRFWFRDAAFIINGLLCVGLTDRAARALDQFPARQTRFGYFHSQDGEWDSNGEALWIMHQFCQYTGRAPAPHWREAILKGARWISRKRSTTGQQGLHAGLLPAGFSAEHLGPNDYYYWDDYWGVAGLRAAGALAAQIGEAQASETFYRDAEVFLAAIDRSLVGVSQQLGQAVIPASPYRRLDAGAIGSIVAAYPLQLVTPQDPRLLATVEFLLRNCFLDNGFFQDMIHSGINAYLTLQLAQVLLRAGDARYFDLMQSVAALASATGQWPEASHPRTRGGCMGDGQHVWAAAEWVLMMRSCFVREQGHNLILVSGVAQDWLQAGAALSFGPAPTKFGSLQIEVNPQRDQQQLEVRWHADWRTAPQQIEICLPGYERAVVAPTVNMVLLKRGVQ